MRGETLLPASRNGPHSDTVVEGKDASKECRETQSAAIGAGLDEQSRGETTASGAGCSQEEERLVKYANRGVQNKAAGPLIRARWDLSTPARAAPAPKLLIAFRGSLNFQNRRLDCRPPDRPSLGQTGSELGCCVFSAALRLRPSEHPFPGFSPDWPRRRNGRAPSKTGQ